jgi:hypothetical protein
MTLSTSLSKRRVPLLAIILALTGFTTWLAAAAYTVWLNPEVRLFAGVAKIQAAWAEKMNAEHQSKVVIFGGSSCMFSIISEQILQETGIAVVNYGTGAGLSVKVPALRAFEVANAGDTLLIAIEPRQLTERLEITSLAAQFSIAMHRSDWVSQPSFGLAGQSLLSTALALRPGGYHTLTLTGKVLQKRPLYRYDVADASPSGWMRTNIRFPIDGPPPHGPELSSDAERFLADLRAGCEAKRVRIAYTLPWGYTPPLALDEFRRKNARFLLKIQRFVPVLKDEQLGADSRLEHFADTSWHLTETGAQSRSRQLGMAIREWITWSPEELKERTGGSWR